MEIRQRIIILKHKKSHVMNLQNHKITIRSYTHNDYDAVISLWNEVGLTHKPDGRDSRSNIEEELKRGRTLFYLAECEGSIIGTIFGTCDGRKGWINRLAINPVYQLQHVGASLVRRVEDDLDKMEIGIISVLIDEMNKISHEFFSKLGYVRHNDIIYYAKKKQPDI
jgi:ribosomal protein S18 acetylase RimI-like enzyme